MHARYLTLTLSHLTTTPEELGGTGEVYVGSTD